MELTVEDIWQIADAGDQELPRLAHRSLVAKSMMDCHTHSKLVLHSLRNNQPVQVTHLVWPHQQETTRGAGGLADQSIKKPILVFLKLPNPF